MFSSYVLTKQHNTYLLSDLESALQLSWNWSFQMRKLFNKSDSLLPSVSYSIYSPLFPSLIATFYHKTIFSHSSILNWYQCNFFISTIE